MPHQYGMQGYSNNQQNQLSPPSSHVVGFAPRGSSGGSGGGGGLLPSDLSAMVPAGGANSSFRVEEKKLTREAMERYLKDRNDMILVILHAKVKTHSPSKTRSV